MAAAVSLEVSKDAAALVQSWLRSPSAKRTKLPQSYPVIAPRSERCGLGAESMQKSKECFTKSKVKEKLKKSFKKQKSSIIVPSTTIPTGHNDCDEDSKVAVIEQTGKNKCTRTALAALLKKKRRKKKRKRDMSLLVAGQSPPTSELTEKNKAMCNSTQEEERSPQVIEETDTPLAQLLTMANTRSCRSKRTRRKEKTS